MAFFMEKMMKKCTKCGFEKSNDEFSRDKYHKTGLCCACKQCIKQSRIDNAEKIAEQKRAYFSDNRDIILVRR
jgi:hypothetical protein